MIIDKLKQAIIAIGDVLEEIKSTPEKVAISELLTACNQIEEYYKSWCEEMDEARGVPEGTTYKGGVSIEFYIEADWWHEASLALRKIGNALATDNCRREE